MFFRRQMSFPIILLAALFIGLSTVFAAPPGLAAAQVGRTPTPTPTQTPLPTATLPVFDWPAPDLLFTSRGIMHTPLLIADQEGRLHLFWKLVEQPDEPGENGITVLYYSQKTSQGWSRPDSILVSDQISFPTAAVDSFGMLHLMWSGENQLLYYTRARVDQATDFRGWSEPISFERTNLSPHLVVDRDDTLHVVFPGSRSRGVYYMNSTDGGDHWSAPANVLPTDRASVSADYPRIAVAPDGTIHLVWTEFRLPSGWPPTGIFYTRSENGGRTWAPKVRMTGEGYDQANITVAKDHEVHVAWNAIVSVRGRYHKWSNDGGVTWSAMNQVSDMGGTEGPPQIGPDSNGRVHLLTTYDGCPTYHYFSEGYWSGPLCLIGEPGPIEDIGWSGYAEEPAFAISQGKYLHAVYWDDRRRLWYSSYEVFGSPQLGPARFRTRVPPAPTLTQTLPAAPTIGQTSTPLPAVQGEITSHNPLQSLFVDLLPAFLVAIIGASIAVILRVRQNRYL